MFSIKNLSAISQTVEIKNFSFFTAKDGLSNYNIHKVIQDNKNFLWVATQDGLNRFDGREFVVFNKGLEASRALFSNDIRDVIYDSSKNLLWVICNQGGINCIDIITCSVKYSIKYNNSLSGAWRICSRFLNNKIYIGTSKGIEVFNTSSRSFENIDNQSSKLLRNGKLDIRSIEVDKKGNLWLSVLKVGILIIDPNNYSVLRRVGFLKITQSSNSNFWPLCGAFNNDCFWLCTKGGVYKMKFTTHYEITRLPLTDSIGSLLNRRNIAHISFSNEYQLLLGGNGLFKYRIDDKKLLKLMPSDFEKEKWLSDITFCFEDVQQNLWIGCKQGLGQLKNNQVAFNPVKNNSSFNYKMSHVYAVCAVNKDRQLVGTKEGLFLITKQKIVKQLSSGGLVQNIPI